jgi:hypothetical protein
MPGARTLFDVTSGRIGERLAQGLLVYALEHDVPFREAFCEWLGWRGRCVEIIEEDPEGPHRHDLVLRFPDEQPRTIELKLWADWTKAQDEDPAAIDRVIVPLGRIHEVNQRFGSEKMRTWEDLVSKVVPQGMLAARVLAGLHDYAWTGYELSMQALRGEIRRWNSDDDPRQYRGEAFLECCCAVAAQKHGLTRTSSAKLYDRGGYWGKYLFKGSATCEGPRIWFGFVFDLSDAGDVTRLAFVLEVYGPVPHDDLELSTSVAMWSPQLTTHLGIEFEPTEQDTLTVPLWFDQCGHVLERLASLE